MLILLKVIEFWVQLLVLMKIVTIEEVSELLKNTWEARQT